jgi:hypothetical protein
VIKCWGQKGVGEDGRAICNFKRVGRKQVFFDKVTFGAGLKGRVSSLPAVEEMSTPTEAAVHARVLRQEGAGGGKMRPGKGCPLLK